MDCLIGLVGDGYVIIAADMSISRSVLTMKHDQDKIMALDSHKLLAMNGDNGDKDQFCEYIQKNIALYKLRNSIALTTNAAANFTRGELAKFLRQSPYMVNLILVGFDEKDGPSLYYLDYLASMHKTNFAAQGYGSYFVYSILDKYYRKGMPLEEGLKVIKICIEAIKHRFVITTTNYVIKVVDQNGVRIVS